MILCYPQKLNYLHKLTDFDPTMTPFVSSENKYIEDLLIKEQAKHFSDLWKKFCPGEPLPAYDFSYHWFFSISKLGLDIAFELRLFQKTVLERLVLLTYERK